MSTALRRVTASTAPGLVYDDGTSCGSTPAGFNVSKIGLQQRMDWVGVLFTIRTAIRTAFILAPDPIFDFLRSGSADQVFLNSLGDFAWTDGQSEEMYVAIRNSSAYVRGCLTFPFSKNFVPADPTPEPAQSVSAGTGLVGVRCCAFDARRTGSQSASIELSVEWRV